MIFFYLILSIIVTWPLVFNLNSLIIDAYDGLLITWVLNWNLHSLLNLNTNIFFPYQNTLAFSDYQLPLALLAWPFVALTGEPLVAYNVNIIFGLALTGYAIFLLSHHLTQNKAISCFAGILFSFSTLHFAYIAHIQLFNFWPVVFATLFLFQKRYKLFVLLFLVSTLTTVLNVYFLIAIALMKKEFRALFFACVLTAPFLLPYYMVSKTFNYVRPINDAIHFSLQFPGLININIFSRLSEVVPATSKGTSAYFGGVFLLLTLVLILKKKFDKFFWPLAIISFVMSLGPALHLRSDTVHIGPLPAIPLPYMIFYYLVPGFAGMRTPSRWIILTAFALTMAIAIYLAKRANTKILVLLSVLILLEINLPFRYTRVPSVKEFPSEQVWLKDNFRGAPIIQFPIYGWWDKTNIEMLREYYSTIHWHPMYNGYSGFSPKEWENRVQWLQKEFPSEETIGYLRSQGIKLVLAPNDWNINLKRVAQFDKTSIYEIL